MNSKLSSVVTVLECIGIIAFICCVIFGLKLMIDNDMAKHANDEIVIFDSNRWTVIDHVDGNAVLKKCGNVAEVYLTLPESKVETLKHVKYADGVTK